MSMPIPMVVLSLVGIFTAGGRMHSNVIQAKTIDKLLRPVRSPVGRTTLVATLRATNVTNRNDLVKRTNRQVVALRS